MDFYDRFIELCARNNEKPSPVAQKLGIHKTAVSNWKSRRTYPTAVNLKKIADYFNVSLEYLTGKIEIPSADNDNGDKIQKFTMYAMEGTPHPQSLEINMDTLPLIMEITEIARNLPKEKVEALLTVAKAIR